MAKKKKKTAAPKKAAKASSKKTAKKSSTKKKRATKKKSAAKRKAGKKTTAKKKKKGTGKKAAAKSRIDQLRDTFVAKKRKTAARRSKSRTADVTGTVGGAGTRSDAEAAVKAMMPNAKIVHPSQPDHASAIRNVTVQGVRLRTLKEKYDEGADSAQLASADATPAVRSKVVYVQLDDEADASSMGPKAVVVRDNQPHSLQG